MEGIEISSELSKNGNIALYIRHNRNINKKPLEI